MAPSSQYCTFTVGELHIGIEVLGVQEVIRWQKTTRVPLAPPAVSGLINLRGQIVTAVDLRRRLGLADRSEDASPMNVVVRTTEGVVSLLVDEVGDVVDVSSELFEPPPDTIGELARELILGVYKLPGRLLHALDTERAAWVDPGTTVSRERRGTE